MSIRTTLVVSFVIQIVAAVGLAGWLSFRNGQKTVNSLALQLCTEIGNRIDQQLQTFLSIPHLIHQNNQAAIARGHINVRDLTELRRYFWQQLHIFKSVTDIGIGNAQGEIVAVSSVENVTGVVRVLNATTDGKMETYAVDQSGEPTTLIKVTPFNIDQRPWYQDAVKAGKPVWSGIFPRLTQSVLAMSAVHPVYSKQGDLKGVLYILMHLSEIGDFLQSLKIGKTGQSFIIESNGLLVATSTGEIPFLQTDTSIERIKATDSSNSITRATSQYLLGKFSDFLEITSSQQIRFEIENKNYFLQVLPFRDDKGLNWLVAIVVPEADFMEQIYANNRQTVLLCFLAIGLATIACSLTADWITAPLRIISQASDGLAQGNLKQQIEPSLFIETNILVQSFNKMSRQLEESFDALRQSEMTNRAIVNTIPDLMIHARSDGSYINIIGSSEPSGVYGVKAFKEGKTVKESLPLDLAERQMHYIQQALATGKLQVYEHQIIFNGQIRYEEVRIMVLGKDEVLVMVHDISPRKQAEKALEKANQELEKEVARRTVSLIESQRTLTTLMSNLPGMAYRCLNDSNWTMIFVSQGCYNLTGYLPKDLIKSSLYAQLIHPEERDRLWQQVQQAIAEKRPFRATYRLISQQGTEKWMWEQGRGIFNQKGEVQFIEGFITDITDWVKAKKDLEKSNLELREILEQLKVTQVKLQIAKENAETANKAKSEFLANMSHELRTPLNSVIGFTQILCQETSFKPEQQERLRIINRSGEHLLSLINNILEMSKIEAGQTTLQETDFDLHAVLQDLQNMFCLKVQKKGIQFVLDPDSDLPQYISADEGKLRQVLINLIGNGVKFTDKGGVILRAKVEKVSENNQDQLLQLEVEDTGPGIAAEELHKLFVPFEQTTAGHQIKKGTGLGLAITQKFINLMGGEITTTSTVGVGTCFQLSIPIRVSKNQYFPETAERGKVIGLALEQREYRILVVDDQPDNRLLMLDLLGSKGFSIQEASNGREATDIWKVWHPDLIWMDLHMPEMDGYEATKKIREWESQLEPSAVTTKIIALTASVFGERELVLASGFDDYLMKPFKEEVIWQKMKEYLGVELIYQELAEGNGQKLEKTICCQEQEQVNSEDLPVILKDMSSEWLAELHQASSQLRGKKVMQLIKDIPPEKAVLATQLQTFADNYQFDRIVQLLG
ncbi:MAG: response regulator [Okeania sp. SIO2B9]|nr:response regulator [Okeania sp. SIO2B9]